MRQQTAFKVTFVAAVSAVALVFVLALAGSGGIDTGGGLCPDGIQEGDGWSSTSYWSRLPRSEGLLDEAVSTKWDRVEMEVYLCRDGTMMGRARFRPGTKGR